jgi:peptidoglycan hydrolase CwlO-like protein
MKKYLLFLIIFLCSLVFASRIFAQTTVESKQAEIDALINKIAELGKQKNTLSSQIISMDSQIKLTTLKISQTEDQITTLTNKISRLEVSLDSLAVVLGKRIVETYKKGSLDPFSLLFSSSKFSDFVSRYKYLKVMQAHDRQLLFSMEETKTSYDDQKAEIEKLKATLESQKIVLARQKKDKENLLVVTKNDEKNYQALLNKALAEIASLKRFSQDNPGGILSPQQSPDGWYYSQRDERWATKTIGNSQETILDVGCLISDIAMVFTFYGDRKTPADIAGNTSYFFSHTAYILRPWPSPSGKSYVELSDMGTVDGELSAGRPVIVHLNLGGDGHFIVLKKKEGDDYIMHDPWYGYDKKFKDFYTVAAIDKRVVYK